MTATEPTSNLAAFSRAGLVVNKLQAQALADLMWEGKQAGTTLTDVQPPQAVALGGIGERGSMGDTPAQNRDGSHVVGEDGMVPWEPDPEAHTLVVVADDGRMWQIVRAGIAWPIEPSP